MPEKGMTPERAHQRGYKGAEDPRRRESVWLVLVVVVVFVHHLTVESLWSRRSWSGAWGEAGRRHRLCPPRHDRELERCQSPQEPQGSLAGAWTPLASRWRSDRVSLKTTRGGQVQDRLWSSARLSSGLEVRKKTTSVRFFGCV